MDSVEEGVYFWKDPAQASLTVICHDCHEAHPEGMYWPGERGYGPFNIICDFCGKIVHEGKNESDQTTIQD